MQIEKNLDVVYHKLMPHEYNSLVLPTDNFKLENFL